jgi:hypothetical protein
MKMDRMGTGGDRSVRFGGNVFRTTRSRGMDPVPIQSGLQQRPVHHSMILPDLVHPTGLKHAAGVIRA